MSNSVNFPATEINLIGIRKFKKFYIKHLAETLSLLKHGKISGKEATRLVAEKCKGRESYQVFHVIDVYKDGKPADRRLFRADFTLMRLLENALREGQALLYRGMFAVPKEVWEEYKKNYRTANRFEIFKLEKLTQMARYILVDLDGISFEDLKRVVSYLQKLGIYPEVWQSASGEGNYHIYVRLVGRVERWIEKKKNVKTGEEFEIERKLYYLPYAGDYRIGLVIEGIKEVFRRLGVRYDSVSATRAVWMEGIPNPQKGGKASKKIWEGKVHRLDTLTEKLRPLWEAPLREKARKDYFSFLRRRQSPVAGTYEVMEGEHSNPIDYLQANVSFAFRMLDRGYTWAEIERELRAKWNGDEKAFERAFSGFRDWVEAHYKPLTGKNPRRKAKPKEERKHRHYWEHVPTIRQVLIEDGIDSSLNHIHRKTGIAKGTLSYILRIVSREQILKSPEEAQELLKTYQKGGDRLSEEQKETLRQRQKEKWERYLEQFLTEIVQKRRKSLKDNEETAQEQNKSLGDNEERGLHVREEGFPTLKPVSVQIGSKSITPPPLEEEGKVREDGKGGNEKTLSSPSSSSDSSSSPDSSFSSFSGSDSCSSSPCSFRFRSRSQNTPSERTPLERLKQVIWSTEQMRGVSLDVPEELKVKVVFMLLRGARMESVRSTLREKGYEADGITLCLWALHVVDRVKEFLKDNGYRVEEFLERETSRGGETAPPARKDDPEDQTSSQPAGKTFSRNGKGGKRVFQNKEEAIRYLESLNGRYRVGDRVRLFVISPTGRTALYEFEKVVVKTYNGFEETGERETWELKTIHWDREEEDGKDEKV